MSQVIEFFEDRREIVRVLFYVLINAMLRLCGARFMYIWVLTGMLDCTMFDCRFCHFATIYAVPYKRQLRDGSWLNLGKKSW